MLFKSYHVTSVCIPVLVETTEYIEESGILLVYVGY